MSLHIAILYGSVREALAGGPAVLNSYTDGTLRRPLALRNRVTNLE